MKKRIVSLAKIRIDKPQTFSRRFSYFIAAIVWLMNNILYSKCIGNELIYIYANENASLYSYAWFKMCLLYIIQINTHTHLHKQP